MLDKSFYQKIFGSARSEIWAQGLAKKCERFLCAMSFPQLYHDENIVVVIFENLLKDDLPLLGRIKKQIIFIELDLKGPFSRAAIRY